LFEFDLKMKRTGDGLDVYQQLIQGESEHPTGGLPWSRVNELSIFFLRNKLLSIVDSHSFPMMQVKLAMTMDGIEATIQLWPLTHYLPRASTCAAWRGLAG
jgi:hypothetical protein